MDFRAINICSGERGRSPLHGAFFGLGAFLGSVQGRGLARYPNCLEIMRHELQTCSI